jgi:hypothetical protein
VSTTPVHAHETTRLGRWLPWIGWVFSAAALFILLTSARWKLTSAPFYVNEWGRIGWDSGALPLIASIQLACAVLYLIPQTAVLGTVLLTGYLGGAMSQYARMGGTVPGPGATIDGAVRLGGNLSPGSAPSSAASVSPDGRAVASADHTPFLHDIPLSTGVSQLNRFR